MSITLICGPMFSGKTTSLISKVERFLLAKQHNPNFKLIIITPYPKFTKKFEKFTQVFMIIKYGKWEKLKKALSSCALLGP